MRDAEKFFEKVINNYNRGDILTLIESETTALGPLLSAVAAGVDTVGGMMFGFSGSNSKARSVRFLKEILKFDSAAAEVIYCCARCGYIHEGLSKLNVSFFANYNGIKPGVALFRRTDGAVALNVAELAHMYLNGIEYVWKDCRAQLQHLPIASEKEERVVSSLLTSVLPGLDDFDEFFFDEIRGSCSQEDLLKEVTFWGNDGYYFYDSDEQD
jgi:hypothetical protein